MTRYFIHRCDQSDVIFEQRRRVSALACRSSWLRVCAQRAPGYFPLIIAAIQAYPFPHVSRIPHSATIYANLSSELCVCFEIVINERSAFLRAPKARSRSVICVSAEERNFSRCSRTFYCHLTEKYVSREDIRLITEGNNFTFPVSLRNNARPCFVITKRPEKVHHDRIIIKYKLCRVCPFVHIKPFFYRVARVRNNNCQIFAYLPINHGHQRYTRVCPTLQRDNASSG